jgi:hypothetical protein
MDHSHVDGAGMICPGSESVGIAHTTTTENNRDIRFYECPSCGILLPKSPLKQHGRVDRGNR